jgi:hypothetical protein
MKACHQRAATMPASSARKVSMAAKWRRKSERKLNENEKKMKQSKRKYNGVWRGAKKKAGVMAKNENGNGVKMKESAQ